MKRASIYRVVTTAALLLIANVTFAQLIVDSKDVSADAEIEYVQLMYFMDQKTFKPVYILDYGVVETPEAALKKQKILINKVEIKDSMSPVFVMNALHKSGWDYLGDASYIRVPLMENLLAFTFRRRADK